MKIIIAAAVTGILLLHATGAIPLSSVGGPMVIALGIFAGALAVGIHEAWTERRGIAGWAVSILVSFVAAFFAAQMAGLAMVMILSPFVDQSSLAATGGAVMGVALAGAMVITLLGCWGALRFVSRWR